MKGTIDLAVVCTDFHNEASLSAFAAAVVFFGIRFTGSQDILLDRSDVVGSLGVLVLSC